jgi:hypothetical protein
MATSINDIERVNRNLYKSEGKYYRLFARGITPNNCWLIAPVLRELIDIDVATGEDVYGMSQIEFDVTGTVSAYSEFIKVF